MLNILKGLHYVWQPSLGTVATRTFYQWLISRRSQTILCMLFKIIRDLCFFLPNMISTRSNLSQHTDMQLLLQQPFARSNAYQHSLLPNILHVWNLLPESVINLPFQYFKTTINSYILKVVYPAHVEPIALHYCISLFRCTLSVAYQHINQDGGCTFHGGIL